MASVFFGIATSGGTLAYQRRRPHANAPTRCSMSAWQLRFAPTRTTRCISGQLARLQPVAELERIEAALLAINAADDERNPPETGIMERELKRVKNGKLHLIPASENTAGHGTTGQAKFYVEPLRQLLQTAPKRAM